MKAIRCLSIGIMLCMAVIAFSGCGDSNSEEDTDTKADESAQVASEEIVMDDHIVDDSDVNSLISSLDSVKKIEWEYHEYQPNSGSGSMHLGEIRESDDDSTISTIKANLDILTGEKTNGTPEIWTAEIKQNDSDGDYDLFYAAIDAVRNDKIDNDAVKEWLDSNIESTPEQGEYDSSEFQSGDAVYELVIYGGMWQGEYSKDITLTIKGAGWDDFIADKV